MPIDLLIKSNRLPDGSLMSTCAGWPTYRELWVPGIAELKLERLRDLVELGRVEITPSNRDDVVAELSRLRDWINSKLATQGNHEPEIETNERNFIDTCIRLIADYVDDDCTEAGIF